MNPLRFSIFLAVSAFWTFQPLSASAQSAPSMNASAQAKESGNGFGALGSERPKGAETIITAREEANFDNKTSIAEFVGSVVVRDPQFTLTCDRLKAFLKPGGRGLERVEAMGNVVIRQENTDNRGSQVVSTARSGKAVFMPDTGDIDLQEWPQVQQGINAHVSTEASTRMILNRAGRINTVGSSKTVIVDAGEGGR